MESVLIVIHLLLVGALVVVVLLQRSEGGALGIGGGGGGFMSGRSAANLLTRTTAILATGFFLTSLGLTILAGMKSRPSDVLDQVPVVEQNQTAPTSGDGATETKGGVLDELNKIQQSTTGSQPSGPQVPTSQ
ncbi:preprotein translocase subunit SecG [uncultured Cohaesibacter sp.]|uniref:preprotein translocase subunit SecG n=1 Tax=uncultured Cohaesibacter sp. TaxID=1002546 RepID=UPI0029C789F1|nr:preprotein translocase subunit SecG [uncultured Cohaesibacter sp.]